MSANKYLLVFCTIWSTGFAVPRTPNAVEIGDFVYHSDNTARTREQALAFCEEQGGELARIHNTFLYNALRLAVRQRGTYWIDGQDWAGIGRFTLNYKCSLTYEYWNFTGMPESSLDVVPVSCLTLVKGRTAATSQIATRNCGEENRVLCQYPVDGCVVTTTEAT